MKKLLGLVLSIFVISASVFSEGFFTDRFFELRFELPVNFSNNAVSLNDILKKEVEIDLRKIADTMPKDGLVFNMNTKPTYSMNLNLRAIYVGIDAGIEANGKVNLSKDWFDFLGYGNKVGETVDFNVNAYFDAFAFTDVKFGMKLGRYKFQAVPTLFIPIVSYSGSAASAKFLNDDKGRLYASISSDMTMHTAFDPNNFSGDVGSFFNNAGFDIGGTFEMPLDYFSSLTIKGRIPFIPGKLPYGVKISTSYTIDTTVQDIIANEMDEAKTNSSEPVVINEIAYINRPMKIDGYYHFKPIGSLIDLCAGAGFGVYHPFVENAHFYPEYYLGAQLNLIGLLKFGLSTEYTDQIFKHELGVVFNFRVMEFDAGISVQSASFAKSFSTAGLGAYIIYSIGF